MTFFQDLDALIASSQPGDQSAASILASLGTPSVSVAVLDNGSITSHCFSTVGDDADALFQACSISKAATALATMRLIEQGRFTLESRIVDLLPDDVIGILTDGATAAERALIEGITVKQLMSHTSGLSQGGFPGYPVRSDVAIPSARQVLGGKYPANTLRVRLNGFPGLAFSYSGGGITVLQLILETVTGKDFPSLMQALVLAPLDMTRSCFGKLPPGETKSAKPYYSGYVPCENGQHFLPEQSAAGLWTTPTDLLKMIKTMQKSLDNSDGNGLLQRDTARAVLTEVRQNVGLSWFTDDTGFGHAGSNEPGYRCVMVGYTGVAKNCGLAIMTNSAAGDLVRSKLMDAIFYLKGWPKAPTAVTTPGILTPFAMPEATPGDEWKRWLGSWTDGTDTVTIQADNKDKPIISYGDLPAVRLMAAATATARSGNGEGFREFVLEAMALVVKLEEEEGKLAVRIIGMGGQPKMVLRRAEAKS